MAVESTLEETGRIEERFRLALGYAAMIVVAAVMFWLIVLYGRTLPAPAAITAVVQLPASGPAHPDAFPQALIALVRSRRPLERARHFCGDRTKDSSQSRCRQLQPGLVRVDDAQPRLQELQRRGDPVFSPDELAEPLRGLTNRRFSHSLSDGGGQSFGIERFA